MTVPPSESLTDQIRLITKVVGDDWANPRAKMYIAATILSHEKCSAKLQEELNFERAVNERVSKQFVDLLGRKL